LHRTRTPEGVEGWRVNAGCVHFSAPTVAEACQQVVDNMAASPSEWAELDDEQCARYTTQVTAALDYLAASVIE